MKWPTSLNCFRNADLRRAVCMTFPAVPATFISRHNAHRAARSSVTPMCSSGMNPTFARLRFLFGFLTISAIALLLIALRKPQLHPETVSTKSLLRSLQTRLEDYQLLSDNVVYSHYARVYSRKVKFPDGREFDFDVWGRVWKNDSFAVVTIIPFDASTRTFTLCREYNVAHNRFVYAFPQGQFEHAKHSTVQRGAAMELEEEAGLACDEWINLLGNDHNQGAPQDKYQRETVHYFLCTAARKVGDGHGVDEEENIDVVPGVTPAQVRELVAAGALQSNNIAAGLMAVDWLRRNGMLPIST